jgi:hypothetical protein
MLMQHAAKKTGRCFEGAVPRKPCTDRDHVRQDFFILIVDRHSPRIEARNRCAQLTVIVENPKCARQSLACLYYAHVAGAPVR